MPQGTESDRRTPRQNVLLGVEIMAFGGNMTTKHRIRDLSATGARIDRAGALRAGATVLVTVGMLDAVGATVIWVEGDLAGLRFAEPINPEAARSKTIVSSRTETRKPTVIATRASDRSRGPSSLSAGWISELNSPYRAVRRPRVP